MVSRRMTYPIFVVKALLLQAPFSQVWAPLGPQNLFAPPSRKTPRRLGLTWSNWQMGLNLALASWR